MFRQDTIDKTVKKAEKHFKKGQFVKSKDLYLKALAFDPYNIILINNLAQIYQILGDKDKARGYNEILLKECDEILKKEKDVHILTLKGNALTCLGRKKEVIEVAEEILKIKKDDRDALFFKIEHLEKNRQHKEALGHIETILNETPHNIEALLSKGRNLVELGKFDEAESCYNHVFEIEPKNKAAINLKSQLLKKKNNLTLTSHDLMLKAVESFEMENFKASKDYFKKALDMSPEYDEIWFAQGELFIRTGYISDAIASFKKAFEINPRSGGIVKHKEFFKMLDHMKRINTFLGFEK